MAESSESIIKSFYSRKNILITGATGFLGKVLLWKLINSCPDINTIYVLLRSKNGESAHKRLQIMLNTTPFTLLDSSKIKWPDIVGIDSDITAPRLGLSEQDRQRLIRQVQCVFHCAASVKFDAPLKDNVRDNVIGTQGIIELCKEIGTNLHACVHVSTAYCNCNLRQINEDLHELKLNPDDVLSLTKILPASACDKVTDDLIEGRPNTYTYTKAMAEQLVARERKTMPIGIVRPSIVTSSAHEPFPGWVDNINGMIGMGVVGSLGLLRTINWNYWGTSDFVPVDYVANCLLAVGQSVSHQWHAEKKLEQPSSELCHQNHADTNNNSNNNNNSKNSNNNQHKRVPIFNMTSGNVNPISWGQMFDHLRDSCTKVPTNKIVRPMIQPPRHKKVNATVNVLTMLFSEMLFAYVVDTLIALFGYKRLMVRITKRMHNAYKILEPFTTNQWIFNSDNVSALSQSLSVQDQNEFPFDMRNIEWKSYAHNLWLGTRELILKEENSEQSLRAAVRRMRLVNFIHYGGLTMIMTGALYFMYRFTITWVNFVI